jgi:hypothetical protein
VGAGWLPNRLLIDCLSPQASIRLCLLVKINTPLCHLTFCPCKCSCDGQAAARQGHWLVQPSMGPSAKGEGEQARQEQGRKERGGRAIRERPKDDGGENAEMSVLGVGCAKGWVRVGPPGVQEVWGHGSNARGLRQGSTKGGLVLPTPN